MQRKIAWPAIPATWPQVTAARANGHERMVPAIWQIWPLGKAAAICRLGQWLRAIRPSPRTRPIGVNCRVVSAKPTPGTARLHATVPVHLSIADALRLCGPQAGSWLGPEVEQAPPGMRRFATDLRLAPDDHALLGSIRKAAYVDVGSPQQMKGDVRTEISWRSASLAPLFPVFSGWLIIRPGELVLEGFYAPPAGIIGLFTDRALLRLAARRTAIALLHQLRASAAAGRAASANSG